MYLYVCRVRGAGCSVDQSGALTHDWMHTSEGTRISVRLLYELLGYVQQMYEMHDSHLDDIEIGDVKAILYTRDARAEIEGYFGIWFTAELIDVEGAWLHIEFLANVWDGAEEVEFVSFFELDVDATEAVA